MVTDFKNFNPDLSKYKVYFQLPDGVADEPNDSADLYDLVAAFREKAKIPSDYDGTVYEYLDYFVTRATAENLESAYGLYKKHR